MDMKVNVLPARVAVGLPAVGVRVNVADGPGVAVRVRVAVAPEGKVAVRVGVRVGVDVDD